MPFRFSASHHFEINAASSKYTRRERPITELQWRKFSHPFSLPLSISWPTHPLHCSRERKIVRRRNTSCFSSLFVIPFSYVQLKKYEHWAQNGYSGYSTSYMRSKALFQHYFSRGTIFLWLHFRRSAAKFVSVFALGVTGKWQLISTFNILFSNRQHNDVTKPPKQHWAYFLAETIWLFKQRIVETFNRNCNFYSSLQVEKSTERIPR